MKNKIGKVLLVLAVFMFIGVGGYYVINYLTPNDEVEGSNKQEDISVSEQDLQKMMQVIQAIPEKASLTIEELNKIDNDSKAYLAMMIAEKGMDELKGVEVKQILVDNFGSDLNFQLTDVLCECHKETVYKYNSESDSYTSEGGHGGNTNFHTYDFFVSHEVKGSQISIKVQKIFEGSSGDVIMPLISHYTSYDDALNKKNEKKISLEYVDKMDENFEKFKQEIYEMEKESLPTYTYTFESKNGKFLFKDYVVEDKKVNIDSNSSYLSIDQILKSKSGENNGSGSDKLTDKYTMIDINNDGYREFIYADFKDLNYNYEIYRGSEEGYKLAGETGTIHNEHGGIKKEPGKDYLYVYIMVQGFETIKHFTLTETSYELKEISDGQIKEGETYYSESVKDEIIWFEL